MERVKTMVASGLRVQPWPYLEGGDRVRIEQGPLRGLDGIVVSHENEYRLVVNDERIFDSPPDRAALAAASTQWAYV